jgi:hypothetical protein
MSLFFLNAIDLFKNYAEDVEIKKREMFQRIKYNNEMAGLVEFQPKSELTPSFKYNYDRLYTNLEQIINNFPTIFLSSSITKKYPVEPFKIIAVLGAWNNLVSYFKNFVEPNITSFEKMDFERKLNNLLPGLNSIYSNIGQLQPNVFSTPFVNELFDLIQNIKNGIFNEIVLSDEVYKIIEQNPILFDSANEEITKQIEKETQVSEPEIVQTTAKPSVPDSSSTTVDLTGFPELDLTDSQINEEPIQISPELEKQITNRIKTIEDSQNEINILNQKLENPPELSYFNELRGYINKKGLDIPFGLNYILSTKEPPKTSKIKMDKIIFENDDENKKFQKLKNQYLDKWRDFHSKYTRIDNEIATQKIIIERNIEALKKIANENKDIKMALDNFIKQINEMIPKGNILGSGKKRKLKGVKKGRGRPKKEEPKKGRGRPKKEVKKGRGRPKKLQDRVK